MKGQGPGLRWAMGWGVAICALAIALMTSNPLWARASPRILSATVISITDGDTLVVQLQGHKEKVRLIGIDTPECRPNSKAERDTLRTGADLRTITKLGRKATRYVKSILRPGDRVEIELDVQERDRYGRLLGYVWLQDGRMLNEWVVRAGYAGLTTVPPNVKYQTHLRAANSEGQRAKRGLWGDRRKE